MVERTTIDGEDALVLHVSSTQIYKALTIVLLQGAIIIAATPLVCAFYGPWVVNWTTFSEDGAWYAVFVFWMCFLLTTVVRSLMGMKQLRVRFVVTKNEFRRVRPSGQYEEGKWSEFDGVLRKPWRMRFALKMTIPLRYWETARPSKKELGEVLAFADVDPDLWGVRALVRSYNSTTQ